MILRLLTNGFFGTKLAYALACGREPKERNSQRSWIWRSRTYKNIQVFLRLCCHGKLPTSAYSDRQGLDVFLLCRHCEYTKEDIDNILKKCPLSVALWRRLGVPKIKRATFFLSIKEWLWVIVIYMRFGPGIFHGTSCFPRCFSSYGKRRNAILFYHRSPN